ncbi:MAG TPA: ornithine carbamoyltransferase [Candidatus Omnitrophota bacterium]|nr:ornithine carbamoyltransferase [Candidatus Omnitrophota bacterium]HQQ06429.1 ornithine carbamoyltransferase [Candidatus Omnitrophota bacterium]
MKKDLLTVGQLSKQEIYDIFSLTARIKKSPAAYGDVLKGKSLALIFQKPSNRTYVSFYVGMFELGGTALYLGPDQIKLGERETVHDVAKTLSRYVNGIVLRTFAHQMVVDMAQYADVPVINGLSDFSHPCQALADLFTVREKFGTFKGITLAYIGDGNNVCNSLISSCAKLGVHLNIATPRGYEPDASVVKSARAIGLQSGAVIRVFDKALAAASGADVLYTDVWASMGQEKEAQKRKKAFKAFQLNSKLLAAANKGAYIMHCLPAHRGEEITDDVIDGANSIVFDEAENRLHVQKAVLVQLMGR